MEKRVDVSLSLLFFWVKGFIAVDSRFVRVSKGNTILGFIPAGRDNQNIPLKNISSTMISSQYKIKPIILGIIIIFLAFSAIGQSFLGALVLLLIGAGLLGSGLQNVLVIQRAGSDYLIPVPFFEKAKLLIIQDAITEMLAQDTDKTDLNMFFEKKQQ
jgi:small-conductance mechanosensitive channel